MLIYVTTQVNRWWEIAICSGRTFNEGRIPRKTRILLSDYKDRLQNLLWICCAECKIPSGLRQHLESEGCRVSLLSQWPITVSNAKLLFNVHGNYGDIYLIGILGDNRYNDRPISCSITANTIRWTSVVLMLASVENGGPTLKQHWFNVSCLPRYYS